MSPQCQGVHPGTSEVRRLTRFEYSNVARDLLGDATDPGSGLPSETIARTGNVFGNDADLLSVSSELASKYNTVAADIAARATATPTALAKLNACAGGATPDDACAKTVIAAVVSKAYHRAVPAAEVDSFFGLFTAVKAKATFASGIAAVIEDVLQAPEFLYRIELGAPAADHPEVRRPTGDEMAARLSFLFWGTIPDDALRMAATKGDLGTAAGVAAQAQRLVNAPQARPVVRFFFDNLLPISGLTNLARDKTKFPVYTQPFAAALREETQTFLEHQIFDADSPGTWASALTAPYTYVNDQLATFYGMPGVTGPEFRKVNLPDPTKRLGLLTQGGILTGTITSNESNPVLRGSFIINKMMCMNIALPTDPEILKLVKIPEGVSGPTARDRFTKHRAQAVCAGCHSVLDPVGFALENYDPIGQWRDKENDVMIDATGNVPGGPPINGPVELVKSLAATDGARDCFAQHWQEFGYGKTLGDSDSCTKEALSSAFKGSGGNIKQLLVALTQTDSFLYLPAKD
jgi:Protein of unknown function (DUF1592)/Protein of unknown function (DUF1588)/Protein of unknown function (DUF1585)/Protein of unknown function (DUF1587)/Protein of unknown function (DUF1595)